MDSCISCLSYLTCFFLNLINFGLSLSFLLAWKELFLDGSYFVSELCVIPVLVIQDIIWFTLWIFSVCKPLSFSFSSLVSYVLSNCAFICTNVFISLSNLILLYIYPINLFMSFSALRISFLVLSTHIKKDNKIQLSFSSMNYVFGHCKSIILSFLLFIAVLILFLNELLNYSMNETGYKNVVSVIILCSSFCIPLTTSSKSISTTRGEASMLPVKKPFTANSDEKLTFGRCLFQFVPIAICRLGLLLPVLVSTPSLVYFGFSSDIVMKLGVYMFLCNLLTFIIVHMSRQHRNLHKFNTLINSLSNIIIFSYFSFIFTTSSFHHNGLFNFFDHQMTSFGALILIGAGFLTNYDKTIYKTEYCHYFISSM